MHQIEKLTFAYLLYTDGGAFASRGKTLLRIFKSSKPHLSDLPRRHPVSPRHAPEGGVYERPGDIDSLRPDGSENAGVPGHDTASTRSKGRGPDHPGPPAGSQEREG